MTVKTIFLRISSQFLWIQHPKHVKITDTMWGYAGQKSIIFIQFMYSYIVVPGKTFENFINQIFIFRIKISLLVVFESISTFKMKIWQLKLSNILPGAYSSYNQWNVTAFRLYLKHWDLSPSSILNSLLFSLKLYNTGKLFMALRPSDLYARVD